MLHCLKSNICLVRATEMLFAMKDMLSSHQQEKGANLISSLKEELLCMQDLECLPNLRVLDVSSNRVADITGVETLSQLTDLWLNDNAIDSLAELAAAAGGPTKEVLTILYLAGNPAVDKAGGHAAYRAAILKLFPKLQQLDDEVL